MGQLSLTSGLVRVLVRLGDRKRLRISTARGPKGRRTIIMESKTEPQATDQPARGWARPDRAGTAAEPGAGGRVPRRAGRLDLGVRNLDGLPDVGDPFNVAEARRPVVIPDADNAYVALRRGQAAVIAVPAGAGKSRFHDLDLVEGR